MDLTDGDDDDDDNALSIYQLAISSSLQLKLLNIPMSELMMTIEERKEATNSGLLIYPVTLPPEFRHFL